MVRVCPITALASTRRSPIWPNITSIPYTRRSGIGAIRCTPARSRKAAGGVDRDRLTSFPTIPLQDPLKGLVKQAHRQHLRIIPWFEYGLVDADQLSDRPGSPGMADDNYLAVKPPVRQAYAPVVPNHEIHCSKPSGTLKQEVVGANQGWLNPFHPRSTSNF